jgi:hypothetical protein
VSDQTVTRRGQRSAVYSYDMIKATDVHKSSAGVMNAQLQSACGGADLDVTVR